MDKRFDRLERTKADKQDARRLSRDLQSLGRETRRHISAVTETLTQEIREGDRRAHEETRHHIDAVAETLREEIREGDRRGHEETRRHFDVVAESLRDDIRLFADAIGRHSELLDNHETRLSKLERQH